MASGSWTTIDYVGDTATFIIVNIYTNRIDVIANYYNASTVNVHQAKLLDGSTIVKSSSVPKNSSITLTYSKTGLSENTSYIFKAIKYSATGNVLGRHDISVTTATTPPPPTPDPVFTYFTYASPTLGKALPVQTFASTTDTTSIGTTVSGISSNQTPLGIVGFPPGMNLSPYTQSGITYFQLSGTPTQSGYFHFKLTATGPGGTTTSKIFSILVYKPVSWIDQTLSDGKVGVPYSDSVSALNATSYSISPAFNLATSGLSFNSVSGLIAGTPKETTSYTFVISARNGGDSISKSFTISFKSGGRRIEDGISPYPIISNKKRYDSETSSWVNLTIAKRYNAATSQWIDISN